MNYQELKKEASRLGINSFGVPRPELEKQVMEKIGREPDPSTPEDSSEPPARGRSNTQDRASRVPLSGKRMKLTVEDRDQNYKYRFVQDDKMGRIDDFKNAGYELVKKKDGTYDSRVTGTHKDGSPRYDFLMRQKKEYYEEDQRAKEAAIKEKEKAAIVTPGDGQFQDVKLQNTGSSFTRMG